MSEHWVGSDVGWMVFGAGMLVLLVGGLVTAACLLRDPARPPHVTLFAAVLGVGVLAGNLLGLEAAFVSVPVLGLYAGAWMWFGRLLLTASHSTC